MSGHMGLGLDPCVDKLAVQISRMLQVLATGHTGACATHALALATRAALTAWATPGREAGNLIEVSDFLANSAAHFPVTRPTQTEG